MIQHRDIGCFGTLCERVCVFAMCLKHFIVLSSMVFYFAVVVVVVVFFFFFVGFWCVLFFRLFIRIWYIFLSLAVVVCQWHHARYFQMDVTTIRAMNDERPPSSSYMRLTLIRLLSVDIVLYWFLMICCQ